MFSHAPSRLIAHTIFSSITMARGSAAGGGDARQEVGGGGREKGRKGGGAGGQQGGRVQTAHKNKARKRSMRRSRHVPRRGALMRTDGKRGGGAGGMGAGARAGGWEPRTACTGGSHHRGGTGGGRRPRGSSAGPHGHTLQAVLSNDGSEHGGGEGLASAFGAQLHAHLATSTGGGRAGAARVLVGGQGPAQGARTQGANPTVAKLTSVGADQTTPRSPPSPFPSHTTGTTPHTPLGHG
jgi:hypothetical protein